MTTSVRASALACALLATTALHAPAYGQVPDQPVPPANYNLEENGVDLVSGKYYLHSTDLSIGAGGDHGLTFVRTNREHGADHNFLSAATQLSDRISISIGAKSDEFPAIGQPSLHGTGATLTGTSSALVYTTLDGTRYEFSQIYGSSLSQRAEKGRVSRVVFPDGRIWTYSYLKVMFLHNTGTKWLLLPAVRLQSVASNDGYQLTFKYALDTADGDSPSDDVPTWMTVTKVTAINKAVDYCNPQANVCSNLSQSWPTVIYQDNSTTRTKTDALGRTTTVTYDSQDRITAVKRPSSSTNDIVIGYDTAGRVASFNGGNGLYTYGYADNSGIRTTTVTDPLSNQTVVKSNLSIGKITSITDALNRNTYFSYDGSSRLTQMTKPEGNATKYSYDARSNVTEVRQVSKTLGTPNDIVVSASYAATCANALTCNKPVTTTDASGAVTNYSYDPNHGGLLSVTLPAPSTGAVRPQTRYSYAPKTAYYKDSSGTIVAAPSAITKLTGISACQTAASCAGMADEVKTSIAYGAAGVANNLLPTSIAKGAGDGSLTATQAMAYDSIGNLITVDGPLTGTAYTTRFRYDAARQPIGTVSPDPDGAGDPLPHRAQRATYNADGQVTKLETGTVTSQSDAAWNAMSVLETVQVVYDDAGHKLVERLSSGSTTHAATQYSYDAKGRLECTAQRMNPAEFNTLPASACTHDTAGGFGPDRIARAHYDALDRVTRVETGYGTASVRDEMHRSFTPNGLVQHLTDANGNKSELRYDGHDRQDALFFPAATTTGAVNYTYYEYYSYDTAGRISAKRIRDGRTIGFGYDALNRVVLKNLPGTEPDVSYGYDNLGRLTSAQQTGNALSFSYDALGRNTQQAGPLGTVSSQYDLAGARTRLAWPDAEYVNMFRDGLGRLIAIEEWDTDAPATFGYDDLGRPASLKRYNEAAAATFYAYDGASRLSEMMQDLSGTAHDLWRPYSYNPAHQIVSTSRSNDAYVWMGHGSGSTTSTVNGLNQLVTHGGATLGYDLNGNLTNDGQGRSFTYDSENRLVSSTANGVTVTLAYDPLGRLYQVSGPSGTTRFVYDGDRLIAEYDGAGALIRRYVHGEGVDQPLVRYENGVRSFYHTDERGSVIALSNDAGTAAAINAYDEYGNPGNGTVAGRFGYTGQVWIAELGLYYYKARFYHPKLGRFLQVDPLLYGDGMNPYIYVGNDPINFTDPTGMASYIETCKGGSSHKNSLGDYVVTARVCTYTSGDSGIGWGPRTFWDPGLFPGSGVVAEPKLEQRTLTRCEIAFASDFLSKYGLPTTHLTSVRFHNGMSGVGPIVDFAGWRGNPAITRGNDVYVASTKWTSVTDNQNSTFWAEIVHTSQYAQYGSLFAGMYAHGVIDSWSQGQNGWNGNAVEDYAHQLGELLRKAWTDDEENSC